MTPTRRWRQGGQRLHPARRLGGAAVEPRDREVVRAGLDAAGLPEDAVQLIATADRAAVGDSSR